MPTDHTTFEALLKEKGFPTPALVERDAGGLDPHCHDFEPMALVLDGEIAIEINGKTTVYRSGDVFHLERNQLHSERYGAEGVRYLASRKE
jgi:mannose-6-phosphate isomerase-like protein (cupin superfamily)